MQNYPNKVSWQRETRSCTCCSNDCMRTMYLVKLQMSSSGCCRMAITLSKKRLSNDWNNSKSKLNSLNPQQSMWKGLCRSHAGIRIYGSWHPRSFGHSSAKSWFTSARHERKARASNGSTSTSRTSAPCRTVNRKESIIAGTKPSPQEQRNFRMHIRNRFHRSGYNMVWKPNGSEQVIQIHRAFRKTKRTNSRNCSSFPPDCFCFS